MFYLMTHTTHQSYIRRNSPEHSISFKIVGRVAYAHFVNKCAGVALNINLFIRTLLLLLLLLVLLVLLLMMLIIIIVSVSPIL